MKQSLPATTGDPRQQIVDSIQPINFLEFPGIKIGDNEGRHKLILILKVYEAAWSLGTPLEIINDRWCINDNDKLFFLSEDEYEEFMWECMERFGIPRVTHRIIDYLN